MFMELEGQIEMTKFSICSFVSTVKSIIKEWNYYIVVFEMVPVSVQCSADI